MKQITEKALQDTMNAIEAAIAEIIAANNVIFRREAEGIITTDTWKALYEANNDERAELNAQHDAVRTVYDYVVEQRIGALFEDEALPEPSAEAVANVAGIVKAWEPQEA